VTRVLLDGVVYQQQRAGGISRCFNEVMPRIADTCNDIVVLLHLPPLCHADLPAARRLRIIKDIRLRPGRFFNRPMRRLSQWRARLHRPDVFHSTYYTRPYWQGPRTVVTVHDFVDEHLPALFSNFDFQRHKRAVIEQADAVIAVSDSTRRDILRFTDTDADKVTVVHHAPSGVFADTGGVDPDAFADRRSIQKPYWLYVGDRVHYKNFGTLLRAFVRVADETGGSLVLLGGNTGELAAWQQDLVIREGLEQRVHQFGYLPDVELCRAYAGAAAFVFPSLAEGFGIPLLEAMACRTPVLASDIPVFHEVAEDAALFFDPHDETAVAAALTQSLEPSVRRDLVNAGQRRVKGFSWDTAAEQIADIYRSLA
jgi:glycosyltransferase involved in cell wall biosynthesis